MGTDDRFEQALGALLAGEPVAPSFRNQPEDASLDALRVLSAISQTSREVLFGMAGPEREGVARWGHLEIRDEVGRGTSGTVYRAWDPRLAREVALKLLDPDNTSAGAALDEGRLLARVRHPHVVSVYGADTFDGVPGLWMELVEGDSLDALVERDGPMSVADAVLIGIDLANALAAIHAAGILHRDVKARNVVRQRGGRLVLMDFGAGSGAGSLAAAADGVGTPLYMAPEVLEGAPASAQNDVYGLGVLLYHLMTGSYPVAAADLAELRAAHRTAGRPALFAEREDVCADVRGVVERACAPDIARRFASARDIELALVDALGALLADRARVVPTSTRQWRRWRRVVRTSVGVAAGVLLTIWLGWDTGTGRAARRYTGLPVPPRSPLYFGFGGAIGVLEGGALRLLPGHHHGATALAVTERFGVRTLSGVPPWIKGTWFGPDGTPLRSEATVGGVCCYSDGTTDGDFNYALRQDSTLLEPIGSRPLAPPAIHRFGLDWTEPVPLFDLGMATSGVTSGYYSGIAYAGALDAFFVTRISADGRTFLEQWSRDGRKVAEHPLTFDATSVAVDSADGTIWSLRYELHTRAIHFENMDTLGQPLGSFDIAKPFEPIDAGGLEFAWPSTR